MIYHVYSDYSLTKYGSSYAYVVLCLDGKNVKIHAQGSRILKVLHPSFVGEAMGSLAGIRQVPDGEQVIAHTDIQQMTKMLKSKKLKTRRQLRRQIKELKNHKERLQHLHWLYLKKSERPQVYHWCHRKARSRLECVIRAEAPDLKTFNDKQIKSFAAKPGSKKKKKKQKIAKAA